MDEAVDQQQRLLDFLIQHKANISEKALNQLIEILEDENVFAFIDMSTIDAIDDYHLVEIKGKRYFGDRTAKATAGILRIALMLGEGGREKVLSELIDVRESLAEAKRLAEISQSLKSAN